MKSQFGKKLQVLIVEDNPLDSKILLSMLSSSPIGEFETRAAASLSLAFEEIMQHRFDVVILDLNLEDSRGIDTLQKFHRKFPHLPVVINTGSYQDDLGLQAIKKGAQDYLVKGTYKSYMLVKSLYYAVERKKAEEELKTAYTHLKETQIQLIQAEKMNVVGGLASGIAHEVKNPLATIIYGVEYLGTKLGHHDDQINLTLESIKEAARTADDIIKGLLDFASLSLLKKTPENLNDVIARSLPLVRLQCDRNGIEVKKALEPQLPLIKIDKNRIEQVIVNVILNALQAMKDGGTLTIKTAAKEFSRQDNGWMDRRSKPFRSGDHVVILDIEDTGPGIKEAHLVKIFDPFFTTRRASGGVGLGLAIARTIMNNHGGHIRIMNCESGGARARLIFRV